MITGEPIPQHEMTGQSKAPYGIVRTSKLIPYQHGFMTPFDPSISSARRQPSKLVAASASSSTRSCLLLSVCGR